MQVDYKRAKFPEYGMLDIESTLKRQHAYLVFKNFHFYELGINGVVFRKCFELTTESISDDIFRLGVWYSQCFFDKNVSWVLKAL